MYVSDLVGIGFGPANLSLAITNRESGYPLNCRYIDPKESFSWHPGMLLNTSRLQVTFLKDLITIVNPKSQYTFINFLHEHDRLNEFINLRTFYPTRIEYDQYYQWVARQFRDEVEYGKRVTRISPIEQDGRVCSLMLEVSSLDKANPEYIEARSISVALGGEPWIPEGVSASINQGICHSSDTLHMLNSRFEDIKRPYRFVVVGSGQTAADVFYYLINAYPNADITLATRGFGIKPQDDTHLVNELFFPEAVDMWYDMPEPLKSRTMERHKDVTHSAADIDLLEPIYDALYTDRVTGANRLHLKRFHDLQSSRFVENEIDLKFNEMTTGKSTYMRADGVILATGYDRSTPLPLLEDLKPWLHCDNYGYVIDRQYAIETDKRFEPRIYVPGYSERTHGFTETLLSILPVRSSEILNDARLNLKGEYIWQKYREIPKSQFPPLRAT